MATRLLLIPLLALATAACQQVPRWVEASCVGDDIYPGARWAKAAAPENLGWSPAKLAATEAYAETIGTTALMVVHRAWWSRPGAGWRSNRMCIPCAKAC